MDLKRVPKWAWVVAGLVAVAAFIYFRRQSQAGSTGATATGAGSDSTGTGVDESQLASDIGAQLAASMGGTPSSVDGGAIASPDNSALVGTFLQTQAQSFSDYLGAVETLAASGVGGGSAGDNSGPGSGGSGVTNPPPPITNIIPPKANPFVSQTVTNPKTKIAFRTTVGGKVEEKAPGGNWYNTSLKKLPSF
jgi:hypothetical protein